MIEKFDSILQTKILALMVRDLDFMSRCSSYIKAEYFDTEPLSDICMVILDLHQTYKAAITPNVLINEIEKHLSKYQRKNKEEYAKLLESILKDSLYERLYIRDNVINFVSFQEHKNAISESIDLLKQGNTKSIRKVMESAFIISDKHDKGMMYFEEKEIDIRMSEDTEEWIKTGLSDLDKCIYGLGKGELSMILAPPNVGKSTLLTIIGASIIKRGGKVAHFSHEMRAKKVGRRYDRAITGKSSEAIKDDTNRIKEFLLNFRNKVKGNLYIKDYPTRTCTVSDIVSELHYLLGTNFKPDLVITDYAAIMKPSKHREGRHQEIEEINEELRGLAGEFNCHVLTAAQTVKGAVNKFRITIEDLGESFAQSKVADLIIAACQTEDEYRRNVIRLFIAKNRDFEKFQTIPYRIYYDSMTLVYDPEAILNES